MISQKNKGKQKSPGKDVEIAQSSGLLDAYTDSGPSVPVTKDDAKPVTKKNKNQRKREAEKMRQLSESESKQESNEVIDSWEDLDANVDDTNVPRSIEFPVKKEEKVSPKKEKKPQPVVSKNQQATDALSEKLSKLQLTMNNLDSLFTQNPSKTAEQPQKVEKKSVKVVVEPKSENTEKSAEEIKAEREAKKKAKQAAKEAAKNKSKDPPKQQEQTQESEKKPSNESVSKDENVSKDESVADPNKANSDKTPEEIKADREAKKKAKAAAKEAAKNKDKSDPKDSTPKETPKAEQKPTSTEGGAQKSKAELKAERRAKQEEQRAKKQAEAQKKAETAKAKPVTRVPDEIQADRACVEKKQLKKLASQQILPRTQAQRKVMLFSHLHQYEREFSLSRSYPVVGSHIHPSIMTLGM